MGPLGLKSVKVSMNISQELFLSRLLVLQMVQCNLLLYVIVTSFNVSYILLYMYLHSAGFLEIVSRNLICNSMDAPRGHYAK